MFFLRFAYPGLFYFLIPTFLLVLFYRIKFYNYPTYLYPLTNFLAEKKAAIKSPHKNLLFFMRLLSLVGLLFLIARPQWVDSSSKINVEGIDIVLAIDVSGSMASVVSGRKTRIDVAKEEAIRFIEKRKDDPVGIVIFGRDSLSRCPLTLDKRMLKEIVAQIRLGYIDPNGTSLGTGVATAINRLRKSKAKSKIIILLTDGVPTPEKISPDEAIDLAKNFGIKIYTIGIGNENEADIRSAFFGIQELGVDKKLLKKIADETGGKFFMANNATDMRKVYDTINELERTEYETDIFHKYYEAFLDFFWIILLLLGLEFLLRFTFWKGLSS